MIDLREWLKTIEWYDNHTISLILACPRKAFFHTIYRGGLASGVGNGANFGTCIHAGLAAYYNAVKMSLPERQCRYAAIRAFSSDYVRLFGSETPAGIDNKHKFENGLDILDCYFNNFILDDQQYEPVETELSAIYPVEPQPGDPPDFVDPFYFLIRCDGLWRRRSDGDLFVREIKTSGGGVDREVTRLAINRQTTGYATILHEFPGGERVAGVLVDVVGVYVGKREYRREIYLKSNRDRETWRRQTINIVQEWRARKERAASLDAPGVLDLFYQNDQECTKYGLCPFWKGCYHGLALLDELEQNTWTPLSIAQEEAVA
jgi:hypothetical protein